LFLLVNSMRIMACSGLHPWQRPQTPGKIVKNLITYTRTFIMVFEWPAALTGSH
jgi:hypothetical protein